VRDHVHYVGAVSRPEALRIIGSCDAILLPSLAEPFPMAALEAMALGVPVFMTEECGLTSFVRPTSPRSIGPSEADAYVAHVVAAIRRPGELEAMSAAGLDLASTHFDIDRVADALAGLYQQLVQERASNAP
jgi:glycosyltransferase involved in cell wall biosynthesis